MNFKKIGCATIGILLATAMFEVWGLVIAIAIVSAYFTFSKSDPVADEDLLKTMREPKEVELSEVLFNSFFQVAGHLAKSDGLVSREEISRTRDVMERLSLTEEEIQSAIHRFDEGKSPAFDVAFCLDQVRSSIGINQMVGAVLFESLVHISAADGFNEGKLSLLLLYANAAGIRQDVAEQFLTEQSGWSFDGYSSQSSSSDYESHQYDYDAGSQSESEWQYDSDPEPQSVSELTKAYNLLGVAEHESDDDVKMAYRRLIQDSHPDRLQAHNLPDFLMDAAKKKTQEIQAAWETIREYRGIR